MHQSVSKIRNKNKIVFSICILQNEVKPVNIRISSGTKMLKSYLTNTYGEVTHKKTTEIQRMKKQAMSAKCRWIFLSRCSKNEILPRSFQMRPTLKTRKGYELTKEYNMKMLHAAQNQARQQYHDYLRKIDEVQ